MLHSMLMGRAHAKISLLPRDESLYVLDSAFHYKQQGLRTNTALLYMTSYSSCACSILLALTRLRHSEKAKDIQVQ